MTEATVTEKPASPTPGPWSFVCRDHKSDCCGATMARIGYVKADSGHTEVAVLYSHEEQEANGRLIAAAPRMFDALKGLVGLIQLLPDEDQRRSLQSNHRYIEACEALADASESEHA